MVEGLDLCNQAGHLVAIELIIVASIDVDGSHFVVISNNVVLVVEQSENCSLAVMNERLLVV